ncbi:MAG: sulfite dehydrogenase [Oceanicoccus sp.]
MPKKLSRRQILAGLTGAAGVAATRSSLVGANTAELPLEKVEQLLSSTRQQGEGVSALGRRSDFELIQRLPYRNIVSFTPLQDLHGSITPADLHFERHHGGVPTLDPETHELLIHGMVDKALKFSLADLKRMPSVTRVCFIECSGNLNIRAGEKTTPQQLSGLTSQSEWTGVALSTLFNEVGLKPKASWFLAEGGDAAILARSIPLAKGFDDAMIAYAQNGESIRPEQGYPFRLLLPGWEGNTNVKWLRRLEVSDQPFMTREETSKYTDPLKTDKARLFSVIMDARSIITSPTYPTVLSKGWTEIRGLAWSGRGKIAHVDVSVDGGKHWQKANLQGPVLSKAHTRFTLPWRWDGGGAELLSRATDDSGYVQPTRRQLIDSRGLGSLPYHLNCILGWQVRSDGQVLYAAEPWV